MRQQTRPLRSSRSRSSSESTTTVVAHDGRNQYVYMLVVLGIALLTVNNFTLLKQQDQSMLVKSEMDFESTVPTVLHYNNNVSSTRNHRSSSNTTNATQNKNNLRPDSTTVITKEEKFVRYDKVAIVTKIHGPHQWKLVVQSMCLLHYAYNQKVGYDIIIFTAEPIPLEDVDALQQMLAPVNVSIVIDNKGLQEEIAGLAPARYENFMERCNVSSPTNLTWFSNCRGELNGNSALT